MFSVSFSFRIILYFTKLNLFDLTLKPLQVSLNNSRRRKDLSMKFYLFLEYDIIQ